MMYFSVYSTYTNMEIMLFLTEHLKQQDSLTPGLEGMGLEVSGLQVNGWLLTVPM